jgi:hypothetical protein
MASTRPVVQTPLNLIMPITEGHLATLQRVLSPDPLGPNPVHVALKKLGNVHFAQFVFLENGTRLAVLTIYDGSFDDYIVAYADHIGDVFNAILQHIDGGPALIPVQAKRDAFLKFIKDHDMPTFGGTLFSAYPGKRVFDIIDALEKNV